MGTDKITVGMDLGDGLAQVQLDALLGFVDYLRVVESSVIYDVRGRLGCDDGEDVGLGASGEEHPNPRHAAHQL